MLVHAQGRLAEAKRRYAELLEREPRAAVAANNLAWIYADEQQNLDVALDLAERATEQMPDYAEAWDTLGWVYHRKQLPMLAVAPFEKAVRQGSEQRHVPLSPGPGARPAPAIASGPASRCRRRSSCSPSFPTRSAR